MLPRLIACLLLMSLPGLAGAKQYRLETVANGLDMPWCVAFLPDGSFLVTELGGTLRRIESDGTTSAPIAGMPEVYRKSQGGLFDIMLDRNFAESRLVYLSYAEGPPASNATAVARAKLRGNQLSDLKVIYRVTPRKDTPVHYGARMVFAADGTILLTTGDGFDYREAAQDLNNQMGKVIRINRDGTPAAGNPFPESPYVWSYGHRNPQGLAASGSGKVFLHEHGPKGGDEVNVIERGANYGWPAVTFGLDYNGAYVSPFTELEGMTQPIHVWDPSIAPSGLAVYEGELFAQWHGDLLVGALVDREVRRLDLEGDRVVGEESLFGELGERVRDVRTGPDGAIYLLTEGPPGKLIRVVPAER